MNIIIEFLGGILISGIVAIMFTICIMFIFFNVGYLILKIKGKILSPSSTSPILNQSSTHMAQRYSRQNKIYYYESVINPFLSVVFKVKAGNHTPRIIQKRENNHKGCNTQSNYESIDSAIPKIIDNPPDNEITIHTDNLPKDNNDVNQVQTEPLRLVINHLPDAALSPNARRHWSTKHQASKTARAEAGWLAKQQWHGQKPMMKARISYEFHAKDRRHRDLDNLLAMCKPWQDGLIDAGVLFYDDSEHLELGGIKLLQSEAAGSIILIEEIG